MAQNGTNGNGKKHWNSLTLFDYAITPQMLKQLFYLVDTAILTDSHGIPQIEGNTPLEIARYILIQNAQDVLLSGAGNFRFMWVGDFGMAVKGVELTLDQQYIASLISLMIQESTKVGRALAVYTPHKGFDMPYYRADSLPWLIYSVSEFVRKTGKETLFQDNKEKLQSLLTRYEETHFSNGLLDTSLCGDWMDTIKRPSSTWSNICALQMLKDAKQLGLEVKINPTTLEERILEKRWHPRGYFVDYEGTELWGVDASILALYFQLFPKHIHESIINKIEISGLTHPLPILAASRTHSKKIMMPLTHLTSGYHSVIWLHLGLMYLNGLSKMGFDISHYKSEIDRYIMHYRNILETFDPHGEPYKTFFHVTEYSFTMAAAQYVELSASSN